MRTAAIVAAIATSIATSTMNAQPKPAPGKYADVNGVHLYYEIHGSGKPLVLLHGGLGAGGMFAANLPALAKGPALPLTD